jgi:hypothetical protein
MYSAAPSYVLHTYKTFMFMCGCICGPHRIDKRALCVPVHSIQNLFRIGVKAVSSNVFGISTASYCYRYLKPLRTQRLLPKMQIPTQNSIRYVSAYIAALDIYWSAIPAWTSCTQKSLNLSTLLPHYVIHMLRLLWPYCCCYALGLFPSNFSCT